MEHDTGTDQFAHRYLSCQALLWNYISTKSLLLSAGQREKTLIAAEKKLISFSELGQVHNPNKCVIPGITQRLTANEESGELRGLVLNFIFSLIAAYEPF